MSSLGELATVDIEAGALHLLVPIGSCEQHGPHLPLDTDTRIALAICAGVAGRTEGVAVAPPITIGASGEHAGFPGTLSIGSEALRDVMVELVRSADDFAEVMLVNAHGGNESALHSAASRCRADGRPVEVHHVGFAGGDAHAGQTETSIMLAIAPDLVRMDRAIAGEAAPVGELMPRLLESGVIGVSPTGVLGDPTGASSDVGRRLLDAAVAEATAALALFVRRGG